MTQANEDLYRKTLENKKVLITGGLGFIGSNLAKALVPLGAHVLLVDSLIPDYGGNLFNIADVESQVTVNIADVGDENGMRYLVRDQDFLFNLAGQVSHIDSMVDPMTDLEINCRSQLSILEACRYVNPEVRIVYASTRQVYGRPVELPATEDHPVRPTDVNGINKTSGEMYHQIYADVYGLRTTSLRLTNTYGPRQLMKHNRQGFAGWFIRSVVLGEEILLFGDGEQKRDFNYVDDVVSALLLAAETESCYGNVYNLGAPDRHSLLDFVSVLVDLCDIDYEVVPFPEDKLIIDIGDYYGDFRKFSAATGWKPKVGLATGLARTVEYFRGHGYG